MFLLLSYRLNISLGDLFSFRLNFPLGSFLLRSISVAEKLLTLSTEYLSGGGSSVVSSAVTSECAASTELPSRQEAINLESKS